MSLVLDQFLNWMLFVLHLRFYNTLASFSGLLYNNFKGKLFVGGSNGF